MSRRSDYEKRVRRAEEMRRKKDRGQRTCKSGKIVYTSRSEARRDARKIARKYGRGTMRAYHCHLCGLYHLSSKPYDPRRST